MTKKLQIRPQTGNANAHSQRGMRELEESISRDGLADPITVAADDESISGSGRIEIMGRSWDLLHDNPLVVQAPADRPVVIESTGQTPIIHRRVDLPSASDPRAQRLSVAANKVAADNLVWDGAALERMRENGVELDGLFSEQEWNIAIAIRPSNDDWAGAMGLPAGDRAPFQQMTFTLSDEQAGHVRAALDKAKGMGAFVDTGNENSNGNALARVCEVFLGAS